MGYFLNENLLLLSIVPKETEKDDNDRNRMDNLKLILREQLFQCDTNTLFPQNRNSIQFNMSLVKKQSDSWMDYFGFSINSKTVSYLNFFAIKDQNITFNVIDIFFWNSKQHSMLIKSKSVDAAKILPIDNQNYSIIQSPLGTHGYFLLTDFAEIRFINSYFHSGKFLLILN